jgi:hypothetical protein
MSIPVDVTVRLTVAGLATFTIREATITLRPDEDRDIEQIRNLRAEAPRGDYSMALIAASETFTTFDTCSFHVD